MAGSDSPAITRLQEASTGAQQSMCPPQHCLLLRRVCAWALLCLYALCVDKCQECGVLYVLVCKLGRCVLGVSDSVCVYVCCVCIFPSAQKKHQHQGPNRAIINRMKCSSKWQVPHPWFLPSVPTLEHRVWIGLDGDSGFPSNSTAQNAVDYWGGKLPPVKTCSSMANLHLNAPCHF